MLQAKQILPPSDVALSLCTAFNARKYISSEVQAGTENGVYLWRKRNVGREMRRMAEKAIIIQECSSCGKTMEGDSLKFCPYCGTSLKEEPNTENHADLKNAIRDIIKSEGRGIIKNDKRKFIALLKDKVPNCLKQVLQIENALSDDIIMQILLKADDGSDEKKFKAISRIIFRLTQDFGIKRSIAIAITSYLTSGLGWEMSIFATEKIEILPITDAASDIPDGKNETNNRPNHVHNACSVVEGENCTIKERPSFKREPYKNGKTSALFLTYYVCFIVSFVFAVGAVILLAIGKWQAGVASFASSALSPVLEMALKKSFDKIVDGEIERGLKTSSVQDMMAAADYYFGQADYFVCKISSDNSERLKIFQGFIDLQTGMGRRKEDKLH